MQKINSIKKDKIKISLVIPVLQSQFCTFVELIKHLNENVNYVFEIIAVINHFEGKLSSNDLNELNDITKGKLRIIKRKESLFPGASRNIGIEKAKGNYIAFLDVNTMPASNWLKKSISLITSEKKSLLGKTFYVHTNNFEKSFIASTFGFKPLYTIPGSLIKKDMFYKVGNFIPSIRSGEDTDWIMRARLFSDIKNPNAESIFYIGIKNKKFLDLCSKWYLYYTSSCNNVLIYHKQKYIYFVTFIISILLLSFNWNALLSGWNQSDPRYIPHITKLVLFTILLIYCVFRGIILPLKKGTNFKKFSLLDSINILFISFTIDIIKLTAFLKSSFINFFDKLKFIIKY